MKFKAVLTLLGITIGAAASLGGSMTQAYAAEDNQFLRGSFFRWGQARNGWAYCYEYTDRGDVLNNGNPVDNQNCERTAPSRAEWSLGQDGRGHCYRVAPTGITMNDGHAINESECEAVAPSHYDWGLGEDGYTHCYKYEPGGLTLNGGMSVDNSFCGITSTASKEFHPVPLMQKRSQPQPKMPPMIPDRLSL